MYRISVGFQVQELESSMSLAEELAEEHVLELEVEFLQAANRMIKSQLPLALQHFQVCLVLGCAVDFGGAWLSFGQVGA